MDILGLAQPKPASTGLKRPYSADLIEQRRQVLDGPQGSDSAGSAPSLKDIVGFTVPRDLDDASYTLPVSITPEVPSNMAQLRYQSVLPRVSGHTLTNSTSISLPKHWFGPGTWLRG